MNILKVQQVKEWDAFTIANEPISSTDLMERAAAKVVGWLLENKASVPGYYIFCGRGNNGGDGLAIARLLLHTGEKVAVYVMHGLKQSPDFSVNFNRLGELPVVINTISAVADLPEVPAGAIIIEALFGTGLNRPLEGFAGEIVDCINGMENEVISIDMPAGLLADEPTNGTHIIRAAHTLSFQSPRLALFFPENEIYTGQWEVLNIGLHPSFEAASHLQWVLKDSPWLQLKKYRKHAHKGLLGHAMIAAGSKEKMGAAVMAAKACLSSGSGLLTMAVPEDCFSIIQTVSPEAMCRPQDESANEYFLQHAKINAVGIGPGWQEYEAQMALLEELIVTVKSPLVIDATALYHLSNNPSLLLLRPKGSETILTPHVGEFARLFGSSTNSFQRMQIAIEKAKAYNVFIVMKGAYTQVITPGGMSYFNSTGNAGMAKGGSGDVLTGIITSLLAQRYPATLACILGVYAHGLAGDIAAKKYSQQGMTALDIVRCLSKAWKLLQGE
ncbi:bifunctional ADP-dependent NAD(P)H-hydrate dehydratase/NAD(P)H-hydrate epimerase [soil metagenome]